MKDFYAVIDDGISEYKLGTITISDDIEFSMYQTVRQITHDIRAKADRCRRQRSLRDCALCSACHRAA
jgi:hypothetical protein